MWRLALRATLWVAGVLVVVGLLNLPRDVAVFFIGGLLLVLLVPCVAIVAAIAVVDAFRGFNRPLIDRMESRSDSASNRCQFIRQSIRLVGSFAAYCSCSGCTLAWR